LDGGPNYSTSARPLRDHCKLVIICAAYGGRDAKPAAVLVLHRGSRNHFRLERSRAPSRVLDLAGLVDLGNVRVGAAILPKTVGGGAAHPFHPGISHFGDKRDVRCDDARVLYVVDRILAARLGSTIVVAVLRFRAAHFRGSAHEIFWNCRRAVTWRLHLGAGTKV